MSLVERDKMAILRTAAEAAQTAKNAEKEQQLMAVAYTINNAANTGLTRVVYQNKLLDEVKTELIAKGYTIKFIHNNAYDMEHHALIIWDDVKAGDAFPEPSNSGPKYNTHPERQDGESDTDDSADDTPSDSTTVTDGDDPVDDDI